MSKLALKAAYWLGVIDVDGTMPDELYELVERDILEDPDGDTEERWLDAHDWTGR